MDINYKKYLKYKNKYLSLKNKKNQIGGNINFKMNKKIYNYCHENPRFDYPCLSNFGVNLEDLSVLLGKDPSRGVSSYSIIFGSLNIDEHPNPVIIKTFISSCTSKLKRAYEIHPDSLKYFHEIQICKHLTELFLITEILQNISWFYYGGVCEYSFEPENKISTCTRQLIKGEEHIYNKANKENKLIKHWYDLYINNSNKIGDTTAFMVVEKSEGSLDGLFYKMKNELPTLDFLNILMSLILQVLLTINYLNNNDFLVYFNHNDLHTANVLYSSTSEEIISYNLQNGVIRLRTFSLLAKIWDFGTSNMELTETGKQLVTPVNIARLEEGKYVLEEEDRKMCVVDLPTFMNSIYINYIKIIKLDFIHTLNGEALIIFNDINTLVNHYRQILDTTDLAYDICGKKNKHISNLIFNNVELNEILRRYVV